MNSNFLNFTSNRRVKHITSVLWTYRVLWIAPVVAAFALSVVYVMFMRGETWSARQSLIVRDDLLGQSYKPGRFESLESMKSAQETILEIARKPLVIRNALQKLGPAPGRWFSFGTSDNGWPSEEMIESVQGSITLGAPNGAEFGRTEVIILNTKASTRERSRQFISLLLNEIIDKTNEVRSRRLQSMEAELIQARNAALAALEQSKSKLRSMDRQLGPDVDAMNALNDEQGSDNPIKRDLSQIRLEKRIVESDVETANAVLDMLIVARDNPNELVNISSELIRHQPALELLKKELISAQRSLASSKRRYTDDHPDVIGFKTEVEEIQQYIHRELSTAIAGMKNNVALLVLRSDRLNQEIQKLDARLVKLGENRADFLTMTSEVKQRNEIVNKTQKELAEIQGLASSGNANLLTAVDDPQVATRPDEMGKKATVLAGTLGGLMLGLGLVLLVAPTMDPDEVDQQAARRTVDPNPARTRTQETAEANTNSKPGRESTAATQPAMKQEAPPPRPTIQVAPVKKLPDPDVAVHGVNRAHAASKTGPVKAPATTHAATPDKPAKLDLTNPESTSVNVSKDEITATVEKVSSSEKVSPKTGTPKMPQIPFPADTSDVESIVNQTFKMQQETAKDSGLGIKPPLAAESPLAKVASFRKSLSSTAATQKDGSEESAPDRVSEVSKSTELDAARGPLPVRTPTSANNADNESTPSKVRRAIVINRSNPSTELKRRQPSVRPVDLVKSVEPDSTRDGATIVLSETPGNFKPPQPESDAGLETPTSVPRSWDSNPFLKDRSTTNQAQTDPKISKPEKLDETDLPVPEQIKKLSETIANFAKPVFKPPTPESKDGSF